MMKCGGNPPLPARIARGGKKTEVIEMNERMKKEIERMNESELLQLLSLVKSEIEKRKKEKGVVKVHIETESFFDPRKHGHAYCAILRKNNEKIERKWINNAITIYDSKHKYYKRTWNFDAHEGDVIEARVACSWKNEYRKYYLIENKQQKEIKKEEAFRRVLEA